MSIVLSEEPIADHILQAMFLKTAQAPLTRVKVASLLSEASPVLLKIGIAATPGVQPKAVLALSAQLTPSEREALQKAISPNYSEDRGLREGSHGETVNERGRTVFEVGFTRAIRKVLDDWPSQ